MVLRCFPFADLGRHRGLDWALHGSFYCDRRKNASKLDFLTPRKAVNEWLWEEQDISLGNGQRRLQTCFSQRDSQRSGQRARAGRDSQSKYNLNANKLRDVSTRSFTSEPKGNWANACPYFAPRIRKLNSHTSFANPIFCQTQKR
jgi:hypothetical protein